MNIIVLRHSAEKVKSEGKRDVVTASQLEHATGYALIELSFLQLSQIIQLISLTEIMDWRSLGKLSLFLNAWFPDETEALKGGKILF